MCKKGRIDVKKQLRIFAASFVAISSLLGLAATPLVAAAPGSDTCTWTDAGNTDAWSEVANWSNCSSGAPVTGDSLIFDNSSLSSEKSVMNDIPGLALNTITFSGSTTNGFVVAGEAFSLSGGIANTVASSGYSSIDTDGLTLTANQTLKKTYVNAPLNFGAFTITLNESGLGGVLTGNGTLQLNAASSIYAIEANPALTGTINVESSASVSVNLPEATLGTASLVIKDGGTLNISAYDENVTFPNNVTIIGDGQDDGVISACLAQPDPVSSGGGGMGAFTCTMTAPGKLTLTGKVTLSGNAKLAGGLPNSAQTQMTTFILAGEFVSNNFTLTAVDGSKTTIQVGATSTSAKAPVTGMSVITANPIQTLAVTALLGSGIYFISRRVLAKSAVRR